MFVCPGQSTVFFGTKECSIPTVVYPRQLYKSQQLRDAVKVFIYIHIYLYLYINTFVGDIYHIFHTNPVVARVCPSPKIYDLNQLYWCLDILCAFEMSKYLPYLKPTSPLVGGRISRFLLFSHLDEGNPQTFFHGQTLVVLHLVFGFGLFRGDFNILVFPNLAMENHHVQ